MRKFFIYKTTNLITGMFYIGKHETDNENDKYIGSGRKLLEDIKKYGRINFTCKKIYEFKTREEMNKKEAEIVNEKFLKRKDVYNINIGGTGWKAFVNTPEINNKRLQTMRAKGDYYKKCSIEGNKKFKLLKENKDYAEKIKQKIKKGQQKVGFIHSTFLNKQHTNETKYKMSLSKKGKPFPNNKSIGTMWIKNDVLKANSRIKSTDSIPEGWLKGRNMSYISIKQII